MRERVQDALRDPVQVAAFEAGVVVDADSGEQRDLLPAEPRHPPVTAIGRQACLSWRDLGSPGDQELANLVPAVHNPDAICVPTAMGGPVITRITRELVGLAG
jgi:hypothetical protein